MNQMAKRLGVTCEKLLTKLAPLLDQNMPHLKTLTIRSDHNRVEPVEWIEKRIRATVDVFGLERIMVDPDCGLKHLNREVAFGKLENMREARDRVLAGS